MAIRVANNQSLSEVTSLPSSISGGTLTLIKTLTADGSGTNLAFVDGASDVVLDSTYKEYVFKFINIHPQTDGVDFTFQGSTDTGSSYGVTTTHSYCNAYHSEGGVSSGPQYEAASDIASGTGEIELIREEKLSADNDHCGCGELYLFEPSSTTFTKHYISRTQANHSANYSMDSYIGGYFNTTSAIDAIRFSVNSGNIDSGVIKLYGVS
jgi:hypothetical protein